MSETGSVYPTPGSVRQTPTMTNVQTPYGSLMSNRTGPGPWTGYSATPSVYGGRGEMVTPLLQTPEWMREWDGVTPPISGDFSRRSLSRRSASVVGPDDREIDEEYEVMKVGVKPNLTTPGFNMKKIGVAVVILLLTILTVATYGLTTYSNTARLPCGLVNGQFRTPELKIEMERYEVTACNFNADCKEIENEAITHIAEQIVLHGAQGLEKHTLEDKLDTVFYGRESKGRLSVPRAKFWVAFEEALGRSKYLNVPESNSSLVGLNSPPWLLSTCLFLFSQATRLGLVYGVVGDTGRYCFWKVLPVAIAAFFVNHYRRRRAARRHDIDLILQAVYEELRPFRHRGTTPLNLRRLVQTRLLSLHNLPPSRVTELWPSPGFLDGPVAMSLMEDKTGVEQRKQGNDTYIALVGG